MVLNGHSANSVATRLGLNGANILYRWKAKVPSESGPAASALEARVQDLERELRRRLPLRGGGRQERDILKKRWTFSFERFLSVDNHMDWYTVIVAS